MTYAIALKFHNHNQFIFAFEALTWKKKRLRESKAGFSPCLHDIGSSATMICRFRCTMRNRQIKGAFLLRRMYINHGCSHLSLRCVCNFMHCVFFFSEVFKARDKQSRKLVALKKVLMENEKEGVSCLLQGCPQLSE